MFLAINADNLTDFDLHELVKAHRDGGRPATLATVPDARARRSAGSSRWRPG